MPKIVVIGGGWAGCAAALSAKKAGAEVALVEKTDCLLVRTEAPMTGPDLGLKLGRRVVFAMQGRGQDI
jgi:2-polyprenyl-6-methoxyphenol hydroxylase-like FAD-dependent oxidoreductase